MGLLDYVSFVAQNSGDPNTGKPELHYGLMPATGRAGIKNVPVPFTDNTVLNAGRSRVTLADSDYKIPDTYDASIRTSFGDKNRHNITAGVDQINTENPYYRINYGFNF
tara:strand:+ start:900 stop:1226 length:327 start_codon:yes stop_codon:yes gene_type:complete